MYHVLAAARACALRTGAHRRDVLLSCPVMSLNCACMLAICSRNKTSQLGHFLRESGRMVAATDPFTVHDGMTCEQRCEMMALWGQTVLCAQLRELERSS